MYMQNHFSSFIKCQVLSLSWQKCHFDSKMPTLLPYVFFLCADCFYLHLEFFFHLQFVILYLSFYPPETQENLKHFVFTISFSFFYLFRTRSILMNVEVLKYNDM